MNKIKAALVSAAVLLILVPSVKAQVYGGGLVEKSVAKVGNDVIMISEIEAEAQMMRARGVSADKKARCEILEGMLINKLFLNQAKLDSLVVNEAVVESSLTQRINELYSALGGEKQVEEYFGKPIYKLKQEWHGILSEQSLIQDMQRKVAEKVPKLTPADLEKYYNETPQEDLPIVSTKYRLRQIAVYPDREAANLAVKEKLLDIRERVVNGEKFSTLARIYSQDPGSMNKGGELGMVSKSVFWPEFSDAAMALKIGQVSQIVETPDGFHLIQLIDREGDMFNARHILIKPSYTSDDRIKAFDRLDSLRTQILADSITFQDAAKYFSEDPKTRTSGGLLADEYSGSSYFEKDMLKPADYRVLQNMSVGDISEPFESLDNEGRNGNTVYKIIYLEKIIPSHVANYKEDLSALNDDATAKLAQKAIEDFIAEKQKTTYIVVDPMYQGCDFTHEGWFK